MNEKVDNSKKSIEGLRTDYEFEKRGLAQKWWPLIGRIHRLPGSKDHGTFDRIAWFRGELVKDPQRCSYYDVDDRRNLFQ